MTPKHKRSKKTIPLDDESEEPEESGKRKVKRSVSDETDEMSKEKDIIKKKAKKEKKGETGKKKDGKGKEIKKKEEKVKEEGKGRKKDKKEEMEPGKGRRRLVKHGKFGARSGVDSDVVAIDWDTDDGSFETTMNKKQLAMSELEETINDLKRENRNLIGELAHIKPDLDKKTELIEKYNRRYETLKNDFERFKLRNLKEKRASLKYASEKLILNMLEVLDNMDRAVKETKNDDSPESIIGAIKQMRKQMIAVLEKEKVIPIDSIGKPFNPKYHDAMLQEPDDTKPDNTILDEFTKGYLYKDKILRPTKVKVSKTDKIPALKLEDEEMPEAEEEEEEETQEEQEKEERADGKTEEAKGKKKKEKASKLEKKKTESKTEDVKDKKKSKKSDHKISKKSKKGKLKKSKEDN
jgi:molecular chaperone GrpE